MTEQELAEIRSDLKEIKEMMRIISKQVGSDQEIAAVQAQRRLEQERIARQIRSMASLAD